MSNILEFCGAVQIYVCRIASRQWGTEEWLIWFWGRLDWCGEIPQNQPQSRRLWDRWWVNRSSDAIIEPSSPCPIPWSFASDMPTGSKLRAAIRSALKFTRSWSQTKTTFLHSFGPIICHLILETIYICRYDWTRFRSKQGKFLMSAITLDVKVNC